MTPSSIPVTVEVEFGCTSVAPNGTVTDWTLCVYGSAVVHFDREGCPEIDDATVEYRDSAGRVVDLTTADEDRIDEKMIAKAEDERAQFGGVR